MKKLILILLPILIFAGSIAIAGQITIEVENKTLRDAHDYNELLIVQHPQQNKIPYNPIKEVYLAIGKKDRFHYEWNDRDINREMNIDVRHLTDGARICNLRIYPTSEGSLHHLKIENVWYPEFPNLNKYVCELNFFNNEGRLVIKSK